MKKSINLELYKSIIDSDFLLLNKSSVTNSFYIKNRISINKNTCLISLNIFELVKSLKQFIRVLQFLKKQDNSTLNIIVQDKQVSLLLKELLKDYNERIVISFGFSYKENVNKEKIEMYLVLESILSKNQLFRHLFNNNIFLISTINPIYEFNNHGIYKIFNDLNDLKKLIFLVSLIKKIYK
jgi:hypothetical protein